MNDVIETSHVYEFLNTKDLEIEGKKLFALEGSSGAAKTWGGIDFLLEWNRRHSYENKRATVGRETYRDCRDTILFDFIKRLKQIGWYNSDNHRESHPQSYELFGNLIDFTGWSNNGQPSKRQDLLWFNEILESSEEEFKQYNQRTNDIVIFDWNPKVTEHWVYNTLLDRPDCYYLHCTMLQNPFLPTGQRNEILAYEPTPENIKNGTADDYMWKVYGLGQRMNPIGLIFQNVNYIEQWPEDVGKVMGLDFGFTTDPSALTYVGETSTDIYLELLMYEPTETAEEINEYAKARGIDIHIPCEADSSDKHTSENKGTVEMVKDLRALGWHIRKVSKTKSVLFWLLKMKKKRVNIVMNDLYRYAKKEQENYRMKVINGVSINQPIDKFNHFWDSARYGYMSLNSSSIKPNDKWF